MMVVIIIEGGQGHRLAVSLFENMEIGKMRNTDFADEDPPARIATKKYTERASGDKSSRGQIIVQLNVF